MERQIDLLAEERDLILSALENLNGGVKEYAMDELRNMDFEISVLAHRQEEAIVN